MSDIPIDEVIYFDVTTHNPSTGAVSDADSTPSFEVFEEATDTDIGVGGNLTKRTSKTGNYRGSFTASAANGFEAGKFYAVVVSATVNSVAAKCVAKQFRCVASESVAGVPEVDVTHFGGTAATTSGGRPEVNASHISGDSVAADTLELFAEALDQATGQIDNGTFAAGAIDAAAIANGAIDAATFAADVDAEFLSYLVDDATRIDASALNTASTTVGSNGSGLTEAGGTGDHLTAVPWNAAWDAEVQSEVDDALVANNLDHLCKTPTAAADMTTEVADNTIIARILANGDTSAFDPSTDGLQLIRDKETDIETDTQDIQSRLPAALTAGGNMKADALAISGDTTAADTLELFAEALDQVTGQLDNGSFQTNAFTGTMFATSFYDDIYAQVQAVLEEIPVTDFTAIPVSTPTYSQALGFLYALGLNRHTCTATTATIYDGDNNPVGTATVSDDGTTFTRTKYS